MEKVNQQKVWDKIAKEWHEFKKPGEMTLKFVKKQKGKILDLGSGSGRYLIKKKGLKFYLVDFSPEMIKLAKQKAKKLEINAEFVVSELDKLPFENNFFDAGLYVNTLHCIESKSKRTKSLKELYRVLKPGARTKISVWNKNSKWWKNRPKKTKVRWRTKGPRFYYLYEPDELIKDVESVGFKILKIGETFRAIPIIAEKPKS